jgi:S-adenosylmethionine-dependent carboxyl methyltransferase
MSEAPASPAPMEGHGSYNRRSHVQAAGIAAAIPLLEESAGLVPLTTAPEPIVIADYGSSEGHNSLAPVSAAISVLRKRTGSNHAISVIHTDLASSDFSVLFQTPDSYLRGDNAVFASAVGRSFYGEILPPGSVTLGWSSWAVQWLSRIPAPIPDQVQIAYSSDPQARAAYADQAAQDWRVFLESRSREMKKGGRLVVLTMARDDVEGFGYRSVVAAAYAALCDMVRDGVIGKAELERMVIPTFGRSRADLLAPFAASGYFAGLAVGHCEIFLAEDHIWSQYEKDRDATAFGARWAAFSRASVAPTLALGLDDKNHTARTALFIDELESRMTAKLAAAPERSAIPLAKLVLEKSAV